MKNKETYIAFAELFRYPENGISEQANRCYQNLTENFPEIAETLVPFVTYLENISEDKQQELFTKTFDVQPICYLDLGYVIFGEDYKRGAFLMHMQQEQEKTGRLCAPELPDHLFHVLHLLTEHPDKDFVDELVAKILIPGIKKMIFEFDTARVDLKLKVIKKLHKAIIQEELNNGNVYQFAFRSLLQVLETDFREAIEKYNPQEENPVAESFFNRSNSVNQLVSNYKID